MKLTELDIAQEQGFKDFLSNLGHDRKRGDDRERASTALVQLQKGVTGGSVPDYSDPHIAAAYLVKYHLAHCLMAYWSFDRFFECVAIPDSLYICDVGAGTGAGRVGLALALSKHSKTPTVYFDAYERSHAMLSAGSCFWSFLPNSLTSHVPDCTYREESVALSDLPANLNSALRIVTAFHLSLPWDDSWDDTGESAKYSIQSVFRRVSPNAGLFTCHEEKSLALQRIIDSSIWSDDFSNVKELPKGENDILDYWGNQEGRSRFYYDNCAVDAGFEVPEAQSNPVKSVRFWSKYRFSPPAGFLMLRISSQLAATLSHGQTGNAIENRRQRNESDESNHQQVTNHVADQTVEEKRPSMSTTDRDRSSPPPYRQGPPRRPRAADPRRESSELERVRPHSVVHGTVIDVEYDAYDPDRVQRVIVQINGAPYDGKVDARELERLPEELQQDLREEGFSHDFFVEWVPRGPGAHDFCELTVSGLWRDEDWQAARTRFESGEAFPVRPVSYNKGGLLVRFGRTLDGFIPLSHLWNFPPQRDPDQREEALRQLVERDQELTVTVIEVDPAKRKLVLSNRNAERARAVESRQAKLATLQVGSVVTGTVRNIRDFGAFVDVGGIEGLLHISEIDWDLVRHPGDFLTEGEPVEVKILQVDFAKGHVKLSRKALTETPWTQVPERYHVGDVVWAEITRKKDFGAFARLQPGVEGLIHVTEIAPEYEARPMNAIREGDRVEVEIIRIDIPNRRIGLSRKKVLAR